MGQVARGAQRSHLWPWRLALNLECCARVIIHSPYSEQGEEPEESSAEPAEEEPAPGPQPDNSSKTAAILFNYVAVPICIGWLAMVIVGSFYNRSGVRPEYMHGS